MSYLWTPFLILEENLAGIRARFEDFLITSKQNLLAFMEIMIHVFFLPFDQNINSIPSFTFALLRALVAVSVFGIFFLFLAICHFLPSGLRGPQISIWYRIIGIFSDEDDQNPPQRYQGSKTVRKLRARIFEKCRSLTASDLLVHDTCLICLDAFNVGDIVPHAQHPCLEQHNFMHYGCFENWFEHMEKFGTLKCPICRVELN